MECECWFCFTVRPARWVGVLPHRDTCTRTTTRTCSTRATPPSSATIHTEVRHETQHYKPNPKLNLHLVKDKAKAKSLQNQGKQMSCPVPKQKRTSIWNTFSKWNFLLLLSENGSALVMCHLSLSFFYFLSYCVAPSKKKQLQKNVMVTKMKIWSSWNFTNSRFILFLIFSCNYGVTTSGCRGNQRLHPWVVTSRSAPSRGTTLL